jgi:hypothetical protein
MAISQATQADLTSRSLRPLTPVELAWGTVRLRDAFTQIVATIPSVATRLDTGLITDPLNQLVIQVQCSMVLRVLANPDGMLEESINGGDYTRRLDAAISAGALYLSDQERGLLAGSVGSSQGAFTIRPYGTPDRAWPQTWITTG